MSRITQTLEKKVQALDQRVAELSIERITWEQRARIAEREEVRLDRELRITKAALAVADRELRTRPLVRLAWDRLQNFLRGRR
jgi:hypothetical protein